MNKYRIPDVIQPAFFLKLKEVFFLKPDRIYLSELLEFKNSINLLLISSCFKEINCIFAIHKIRHKTGLK